MHQPTRRSFLAGMTAAASALALPGTSSFAADAAPATQPATLPAKTFKTKLYKAKIIGAVTEQALQPLKDAGFDGVESSAIVSESDAAKGREIAEKMGMRVHSVLRGWAEFNSTDKNKAEQSFEVTANALRAAAGYGADAVLTVPCRVGGMPMPEPYEFKIEFDPKTGHVLKVVDGDNSKYREYIDIHNWSIDSSTEFVKRLIPVAEKAKVVLALENVWNNLWVQPAIFTHYVKSFDNPWIKAYFDIGNHVKYVPPEQWVKSLGSLIVKCHVKDWRFTADKKKGGFVHPRDGSIDWPAVRQALDDVGYNGWLTIEDSGLPLKEFSRRMDLIFAGQ